MPLPSFYSVITAAVSDFATHGFDSELRLDHWVAEIRRAAERDFVSEAELERSLRTSLGSIYERLVARGAILKQHPGVSRFTLERVRPKLRDELDRRIMASARLIRLQRDEAIAQTLRRFSGWATSIPPGGSEVVAKNPVKSDIRRAMARTPFEVRRCNTDQGTKLAANIHEILALDSNAIAAQWETHYTRHPRKEHAAIAGHVFAVRGNWALERGLMRAGLPGYTDEVEKPGELVSCRCSYRWLYHLRQLPPDMLTAKGKEEVLRVRSGIAA